MEVSVLIEMIFFFFKWSQREREREQISERESKWERKRDILLKQPVQVSAVSCRYLILIWKCCYYFCYIKTSTVLVSDSATFVAEKSNCLVNHILFTEYYLHHHHQHVPCWAIVLLHFLKKYFLLSKGSVKFLTCHFVRLSYFLCLTFCLSLTSKTMISYFIQTAENTHQSNHELAVIIIW